MDAKKTWYYVAVLLAVINIASGAYLVVNQGSLSLVSLSNFAVGFFLLYITR